MNNYFSVFDLTPAFTIDVADLEKRYFALQRSFHPVKLVGKSAPERERAVLLSIRANEAYEALKNPLTRARHLLALQGIHVGGERDSVKPVASVLMEIMELREALDEAANGDTVAKLKAENAESIAQQIAALEDAFKTEDYAQAAQLTIKLGYLLKIEKEIVLKSKRY